MTTEDYVSFETAKLLKEKGFNEVCEMFYCKPHEGYMRNRKCNEWRNSDLRENMTCTCPTLQMAVKWLREKRIFIVLDIISFDLNDLPVWNFDICLDSNHEYRSSDYFDSYEQACETAIKYCLKHLL